MKRVRRSHQSEEARRCERAWSFPGPLRSPQGCRAGGEGWGGEGTERLLSRGRGSIALCKDDGQFCEIVPFFNFPGNTVLPWADFPSLVA